MIKIEDLTISFGKTVALNRMNLTLNPGEIVGLVGESGSGKSVTALSLMGLLSKEARIDSGRVLFDEVTLLEAGQPRDEKLARNYRGSRMSMVFQEPMTSLNPTMKIGHQVEEQLLVHKEYAHLTKDERRKRVVEALESVGLQKAEALCNYYPHQLSGGMRQRVMIAIALILHPELIIADEPTTALDVTIQNQIVKLLKEINEREQNSMLFITHDLNLARRICHRVLVMKDGIVVEEGPTEEIFGNPKTEYCKHLMEAVPSRHITMRQKDRNLEDKKPIVTVKDLTVSYEVPGRWIGKKQYKEIVKDAAFTIREGETVGLVGESGCGKTTLSKAILGLNKNIRGSIEHASVRPQMIFQDPYSSLNPAKTIGWLLEEPLRAQDILEKTIRYSKDDLKTAAVDMLRRVGLSEEYYERKPSQLSGGQRQRISIGQALITQPKLIIADEPVSALDVTIQDQILNLMEELQDELGLAYLFISHDINVIYRVSDTILVMKDGEILEQGEREQIFYHPNHPYTRELLEES